MADTCHFGLWTMRPASRREEGDVLKAVAAACRTTHTPRPFVQYADSVGGVVRELGPGGYWICDFTPGVHCLLALVRIRGGRTVCSLIHWDKGVYVVRMPPFKTKLFKGTVLQGVLARDGLKTSFVVHDSTSLS
eukprot:jgi/Mesvir1/8265/Mv12531-RA.1